MHLPHIIHGSQIVLQNIIKQDFSCFFSTKIAFLICYISRGEKMKVKVIDENHEKDLENSVNEFLSTLEGEVIDIKFSVSASIFAEEQIYCFSAMILYKK